MSARLVGLGAVTGYGWGVPRLLDGIASQKSAAIDAEVDGQRVWACVIPEPDDGPLHPDDRYEAAIAAAIGEAVDDATARGWRPGPTVGLIFSTGIADIRTVRDNYFSGGPRPRPSLFAHTLHTAPGSIEATRRGWAGPNLVLNAACSSGNVALQTAELWLRSGLATDVVVAGAEMCLIDEIVTGFRRMRVLLGSDRSLSDCRPFQEGSRGFFLGEAAVATVVTAPGTADGGWATYRGGGITHDAFHLVAPEPEGTQLERAVRAALADADASPDDVAVVKAHGSGTALNDCVEEALADRVFPDHTRLCSYKPLLGHAMAAASLTELAGLLAGYAGGHLPARVSDEPAHPRLADGEPVPDGLVVCTSVGLGGANTAAVFAIDRPA